jgi:Sulfotransferase domain
LVDAFCSEIRLTLLIGDAGWLKSMRNSVGVVFSWPRWKYVAWAEPELAGPLWQLVGVTLTGLKWGEGNYSIDSAAATEYLEHNQLVRKTCPPERLLEFKLGSGWEPLCKFLGVEVPDVPYPNINDKNMFVGFHQAVLDRATVRAVQKVLSYAAPFGLCAAAWYWQVLRL